MPTGQISAINSSLGCLGCVCVCSGGCPGWGRSFWTLYIVCNETVHLQASCSGRVVDFKLKDTGSGQVNPIISFHFSPSCFLFDFNYNSFWIHSLLLKKYSQRDNTHSSCSERFSYRPGTEAAGQMLSCEDWHIVGARNIVRWGTVALPLS